MKQYKPASKLSRDITDGFDGEGLRNVLLAALTTVYKESPQVTLPQLLVALSILVAERDGQPHTLATLVSQLEMPFSTASRVVWSLTEEGGELGLIRYVQHPTDRRKKWLTMNPRKLNRSLPKSLMQAMKDYYGDSVRRLARST